MLRLLYCALLLVLLLPAAALAQTDTLTVETIMQDPDTWIGAWPGHPFWTEAGDAIYFDWNPQGAFPTDSLYKVPNDSTTPVLVTPAERRTMAPRFDGWTHGASAYNADFSQRVFTRDADLYRFDRTTGQSTRLTQTVDTEADPRFLLDGGITFVRDDNLYHLNTETDLLTQLTDLRSGDAAKDETPDEQDAFLKKQQHALFSVLRTEAEEEEAREAAEEREEAAQALPPTYYFGKKEVDQLQVDPTGRYVTFRLSERPTTPKRTVVQNYVTESGYAEDLNARAKVGAPGTTYSFHLQDLRQDTTYQVDFTQLPGAHEVPAFLKDQGVEEDKDKPRAFIPYGPYWSKDGAYAVLVVRVRDNKDRWIVRLDPETRTLKTLDRQQDEAWIAGPGISWFGGGDTVGWLADQRRFYFQSERTGYSHLYTVDVASGDVKALTRGDFEIYDPQLSMDGTYWTFGSSEVSPFEEHLYQMPVDGGGRIPLSKETGQHQAARSPDGTKLAKLFSYSNRPPEVFRHSLVPRYEPEQLTLSPTPTWASYDWRDPAVVYFEASDGVPVPARIYEPAAPNGGAVLFVHGAGYLHNVHKGWSVYYREFMFHNLLADLGYVVMDVDYRGSAGYGRDWRTAIYRHMGGRDLGDYIDASKFVQQTYGVDPERVAIYGGSYGGFITLMALFTAPEHFGAGAALRSVTDWAHYNHTYTSNILNTPAQDSLAYARSSPINFAEGLQDPLLIAHGIVDTNVQFQDVVRLSQRLIELGKKNWELAVYPVEGHGFEEPTSWTDEYRRILKLIQTHVGPNRVTLPNPD